MEPRYVPLRFYLKPPYFGYRDQVSLLFVTPASVPFFHFLWPGVGVHAPNTQEAKGKLLMHQTDEILEGPVTPQMTLQEVMSRCPISEAVIIAYEAQAGVCLRRLALFDTLAEAAEKYNLDLNKLLGDLNALARALTSSPKKLI